MQVERFQIDQEDNRQEHNPFIRISQDDSKEWWISISDGQTGLLVQFKSLSELEQLLNERKGLTGVIKISCSTGGGH